jgi:sulfate permease, SulP family
MGFFRSVQRGVTVAAEGPVVIFAPDRPGLERIRRRHPDAYDAFLRFVVRTLSDRLEQANREVAALT